MEVNGDPTTVWLPTSFKTYFMFNRRKKLRFGTTWGWVHFHCSSLSHLILLEQTDKQKHYNKVHVLVCIKVINVVYRPILSDDKQLWYNWMCIIPLNLYIKLNKPYIPASVNVLKGIVQQKINSVNNYSPSCRITESSRYFLFSLHINSIVAAS